MRFVVPIIKLLVILLLAGGIFGTAYHFVDLLYLAPARALKEEKAEPPPPPPPDPSLPEFQACVELRQGGDPMAARAALERFLDQYPQSAKVDEARDLLGAVNSEMFFSPKPSPDKQVYVVRSGDVLTRVAMRTKSTPELIMRTNNLSGTMLRVGQRLWISPADFSMVVLRRQRRVLVYNGKHLFKQYRIEVLPAAAQPKAGAPPLPKLSGKVVDKLSLNARGDRVSFQDKDYAGATHKVSLSIPGYSLYTVTERKPGEAALPAGAGLGLAAADMEEIAVLLSKNDPVSIE